MGSHQIHMFLLQFIMICFLLGIVEAANSKPMFVFGDSYLDTGNHNHSASSWKPPYGVTWPGHPAGRFSDGDVFTDSLAKAIGSSSPIPYRQCNNEASWPDIVKYGVNFAVGGSGTFEAFDPNSLSVQVDNLKSMLESHPFDPPLLQQTSVLLSTGGNDYLHNILKDGSRAELQGITEKIVGEIIRNVKRLYKLGLRRFVLFNLGPLGCIPYLTAGVSYKHCIASFDLLVAKHNRLLVQEVHATSLALKDTDFIILDQLAAFSFVMRHPHQFDLEHTLKPCCKSKVGEKANCGQVDKDGKALYEVCSDPGKYFFWDGVHPTQAGWTAIAALFGGQDNSTKNISVLSYLATRLSGHSTL